MPIPDLAAQLDAHRAYVLRGARLQPCDDALAEDVVQDALLDETGDRQKLRPNTARVFMLREATRRYRS